MCGGPRYARAWLWVWPAATDQSSACKRQHTNRLRVPSGFEGALWLLEFDTDSSKARDKVRIRDGDRERERDGDRDRDREKKATKNPTNKQ